ncbi:oligosaccharide flippase family protein [Clostridiales bacterium FE2011]|nr:oligosaccharide flippase family protein [Clostridiales bacterium FE2011]
MEINKSSKYKSLAKDTGLFTISNFGSKILAFLFTPLYTRVLATTEYGIADLITTTISFIYPILTLAIADATLRYALDKNEDKNTVFGVSSLFTIISVFVLLVFKPFICLIDSSLDKFWMIFVLNYALFNIHNLLSNFVKGLGKTTLFAIQGILHTVTIIICNVLFLVGFRMGLYGYLWSIIIGYCTPILVMFFAAKIYKYIVPFKIEKNLLLDMLKYSIPMIPTILAWAINTSIDRYMIIWMYGLGDSGIYSVAHKIPTILTTILSIFSQAWQISVITNHGSKDESQYYSNVYKGLDFISLSGCFFIILTCKLLASLLFANNYFIAWQYVPMLLISAMFSSHAGILAAAFRAEKKTKSLFVSVLAGSILNIVLNYVLLKTIGVIGAAIATAVSFFIVWLVRIISIQKIVKVQIPIVSTGICYSLLFIISILTMLDFPYAWITIILAYIIVCYFQRDTIKGIFQGIMNIYRKRKETEKVL